MGCMGSKERCDHFNSAWDLHLDFETNQLSKGRKKHGHSRQSPVEERDVRLEGRTRLDVLEMQPGETEASHLKMRHQASAENEPAKKPRQPIAEIAATENTTA